MSYEKKQKSLMEVCKGNILFYHKHKQANKIYQTFLEVRTTIKTSQISKVGMPVQTSIYNTIFTFEGYILPYCECIPLKNSSLSI